MPARVPRQASLSMPSYNPSERIKALTDYGSQVEIDRSVPVKLYFRSGKEMLRMANMYCDDHDFESAFILYYKFITLFLEKLPAHPDFKNAPQDQVSDFKRKVKKVFPIAEEIKKKLKERYAVEEKTYQAEQKRIAEERAAEEERRLKAIEEQEKKDEELARQLQEEQEAEYRHSQEEKYRILKMQEEEKMKDEERQKSQGGGGAAVVAAAAGATATGATAASVDVTVPAEPSPYVSPQAPNTTTTGGSQVPPPPSYSQYLDDLSSNRPEIPDRELKNKLVIGDSGPNASPQSLPQTTPQPQVPSFDRSAKPSIDHHMSLGNFGFERGGLRRVIVPSQLMIKFLAAAERNTLREAETMGILCGILTQGVFKITHLFIPKQRGGHDSCDMENEEELIFFQDEFNLITLGWIHTHPTQTAFLSSVDLHSHFPWQKMMPEAVAIVCSPKFQETGIFRLTDRGLDVIGSCQQKGFHPHAKDPPLFETSGHALVSNTDDIQVADKRI